ncbi:MAG: hypothetical protein AMJ67_10545 [Betaproteobacteria bacterium SG8_41]|nr:MAG: hypothetical protein AMJ67_10545 [Betaproteobacteria bacterium SG8_41]
MGADHGMKIMNQGGDVKHPAFNAGRFTIHDSRFTIHDSRFTIHDSRFTNLIGGRIPAREFLAKNNGGKAPIILLTAAG